MPNIAVVLRDEIRRLARREIKASTSSTKDAVFQFRRDIAHLKRSLRQQQKEIAFLKAQERKRFDRPPAKEEDNLQGMPLLGPLGQGGSGNACGFRPRIMASWWGCRA